MAAALVLLAVLAICLVAAQPSAGRKYLLDGRIVGGSETTIQQYPYAVSLWTDVVLPRFAAPWNFCGATILSNYWVVTGGRCTHGRNASQLYIRAGSTYNNQATKHEVGWAVLHPKYETHRDGSVDYDISLLKLKTPLVYSNSIQAVSLPSADTVLTAGTMVTALGWGSPANWTAAMNVLRAVSLPVMSPQECATERGDGVSNSTMVCAGYKQGDKGTCGGDSGGALVLNSVLVGIVSWGRGCGEPNQPGVFTNVAYFRRWIKSHTGV